MEIRFAQSARRHRIGKARAMFVMANNPFQTLARDDDKVQQIWVALDDRDLELEVIAVVLVNCLLVTHVMPTALRRRKKTWLDK
jgi:alkylhydroperoxidase/carboxymuconolactone decarboxylase family protein YurZ